MGFGVWGLGFTVCARKVDVRLPGNGNSNSHGARPVHLIITRITWIRTSRLSIRTLSAMRALRQRRSEAVWGWGLGFTVWGAEFRVDGPWSRVQGLGVGVGVHRETSGFRVLEHNVGCRV